MIKASSKFIQVRSPSYSIKWQIIITINIWQMNRNWAFMVFHKCLWCFDYVSLGTVPLKMKHHTYEVQKWPDKIFFFRDKVPGQDLHLNLQPENPFNQVNINLLLLRTLQNWTIPVMWLIPRDRYKANWLKYSRIPKCGGWYFHFWHHYW